MAQDGDGVLRCSGASDLFVQRRTRRHALRPQQRLRPRQAPAPTSTGSVTAPSGTRGVANTPVTAFATGLPVVCVRDRGKHDIGGSTVDDRSPPIGLPSRIASQLAIYTDTTGKLAVLAPRGWEPAAEFGADGSGGIGVSPTKAGPTPGAATPIDEITAGTEGGCDGCTRSAVCAYFPDIAEPGVPVSSSGRSRVPRGSGTRPGLSDPPGVRGPNPANGVMIVKKRRACSRADRRYFSPSDHACAPRS